ncbi:amino acid ABC transporter substrate-binding protein [Desulfofalx alkaliphila]|uniref:amino acid ABC transporter substrate-binding protein n=1 Tax=Desulfofalx alkaliphila TaxID=105483 RepID=UPI0004E1B6DE|nr:amino acid ABC transporter substrate-binding protein [Desulfofalx alkaliphila]
MRRTKYLWLMVLVLGLALVAMGCGGSDQPSDEQSGQETEKTTLELIQEKGVLVAGLDDTFAPMGYRDENNNLVGYDIDMGEEIAKRLGVEIQWVPTEWGGVMGALKSKQFDIILSGMSITEERKQEIDFTRHYVEAGIGMVVLADNDDIVVGDDMKGKVVATQTGSSGYLACQELGLEDVRLYDQYPEAFQDLALGRVDVIVVDLTTAVHFMELKPDTYKIAGEPLVDDYYGIGVRKEDTDLREAINEVLTEMMADGTLSAISQKWFQGADLSPEA